MEESPNSNSPVAAKPTVESTSNTVDPTGAVLVMNVLPICWNLPIIVSFDNAIL